MVRRPRGAWCPGTAIPSWRPERRSTLVALTVLAVLAAACASGPRPGQDARDLLRLAGSLEANPPTDGSESFVIDTIAAPVDRAFTLTRNAYVSLQIPFSHFDPSQGHMGGFIQVLRDLDGSRPSTWIDCGRGATADEYADVYDVSLAIGTRVRALDAETSTVETVIRARARARSVSSELLRCRSFGTLEARVAELVRERLAR